MERDLEFVVREVRGKGMQIKPLALPSDRMFWASLGFVWALSFSQIGFKLHWEKETFWVLLFLAMGFQTSVLWRQHRSFKRMLRETGMTEKELLAKIAAVAAEARAAEESDKQDGGR